MSTVLVETGTHSSTPALPLIDDPVNDQKYVEHLRIRSLKRSTSTTRTTMSSLLLPSLLLDEPALFWSTRPTDVWGSENDLPLAPVDYCCSFRSRNTRTPVCYWTIIGAFPSVATYRDGLYDPGTPVLRRAPAFMRWWSFTTSGPSLLSFRLPLDTHLTNRLKRTKISCTFASPRRANCRPQRTNASRRI